MLVQCGMHYIDYRGVVIDMSFNRVIDSQMKGQLKNIFSTWVIHREGLGCSLYNMPGFLSQFGRPSCPELLTGCKLKMGNSGGIIQATRARPEELALQT